MYITANYEIKKKQCFADVHLFHFQNILWQRLLIAASGLTFLIYARKPQISLALWRRFISGIFYAPPWNIPYKNTDTKQ